MSFLKRLFGSNKEKRRPRNTEINDLTDQIATPIPVYHGNDEDENDGFVLLGGKMPQEKRDIDVSKGFQDKTLLISNKSFVRKKGQLTLEADMSVRTFWVQTSSGKTNKNDTVESLIEKYLEIDKEFRIQKELGFKGGVFKVIDLPNNGYFESALEPTNIVNEQPPDLRIINLIPTQ